MTNELKWLDARCPKCSRPAVLLGTTFCTTPGCDHFENHELPDAGASLLTAPDPITIAYLTIGAYDVLRPLYEGIDKEAQLDTLSAYHGGQLGIISAIADLAGALDEAANKFDTGDWSWAYDVCEPIGATLMREGLWLGHVPVPSHAKLIIKDHMMKLNEKPLAPPSLSTAPTTITTNTTNTK